MFRSTTGLNKHDSGTATWANQTRHYPVEEFRRQINAVPPMDMNETYSGQVANPPAEATTDGAIGVPDSDWNVV